MIYTFRSGANVLLASLEDGITHQAVDLEAEDGGISRGLLYWPAGRRPTVGVHLMHPRTDQSRNYAIPPLVRAGCMVLGRAGRWVNNDVATVHEQLLYDVAAGVRLLREQGCEQVVLLGNSGGGSLASLYQAQAAAPPGARLADTAAGAPIDLAGADLPPADAIVLLGAHPGEGACLGKWIDPSVVDEHDPDSRDPALDMYEPANGFRLPPEPSTYAEEFVVAYRAAQRERVARIDAVARDLVAGRRVAEATPGLAAERRAVRVDHLRIHRTMADPAFCDLRIEPDDRVVSAYNNHPRPDLVNAGAGVAEVLTPDAWLSTWSALSTRADTAANLRRITVPVLVVHYAGDVITHVAEAEAMHEAAAGPSELVLVRHADHYGFTLGPDGARGDRTTAGTDAVVAWLADHGHSA